MSHVNDIRYSSSTDCILKTLRAEGAFTLSRIGFPPHVLLTRWYSGPLGLYKGFGAQVARIGPHTLISFIAFEQVQILGSAVLHLTSAHSFLQSCGASVEYLQYEVKQRPRRRYSLLRGRAQE